MCIEHTASKFVTNNYGWGLTDKIKGNAQYKWGLTDNVMYWTHRHWRVGTNRHIVKQTHIIGGGKWTELYSELTALIIQLFNHVIIWLYNFLIISLFLLRQKLGGDKLTNKQPNGLTGDPCMEVGRRPKNRLIRLGVTSKKKTVYLRTLSK